MAAALPAGVAAVPTDRWPPARCAGAGRAPTARRSSGGPAPSTSSTAPTSWCRRPARPPRSSPSTTSPACGSPRCAPADALQVPALLRRALRRGAWVHTVSELRRGRGRRRLRRRPRPGRDRAQRRTAAGRRRRRRPIARRAGAGRSPVPSATCSPSAPSSPARTCPTLVRAFDELAADDRRSALVLAGPDGWGAEAVARGRRRRPPPRPGPPPRLGRRPRPRRAARRRRSARLPVGATRASGFHRSRPSPPAPRWWPPRAGALPEVLGDGAEWAASATSTAWPQRSAPGARPTPDASGRDRAAGTRPPRRLLLGRAPPTASAIAVPTSGRASRSTGPAPGTARAPLPYAGRSCPRARPGARPRGTAPHAMKALVTGCRRLRRTPPERAPRGLRGHGRRRRPGRRPRPARRRRPDGSCWPSHGPTSSTTSAGGATWAPSWDHPRDAFQANAEGTLNLLQACERPRHAQGAGRQQRRRLRAGRPDELPITEEAPFRPVTPYAASKIAADQLALQAWLGYGLEVLRVRAFNHLGPGQTTAFVAPALAERIAVNERDGSDVVPVGNLTPRRDVTDVRDVVRAYRTADATTAIRARPTTSAPAATSPSASWPTLVALADRPMRLEADPALQRRSRHRCCGATPAKLRPATGWEPEIPLDQTLADVLAEHRALVGAVTTRLTGPRPSTCGEPLGRRIRRSHPGRRRTGPSEPRSGSHDQACTHHRHHRPGRLLPGRAPARPRATT